MGKYYCKMIVDGREVAILDITKDSMGYRFYRNNGIYVFDACSKAEAIEYINKWKSQYQNTVDYLKANGRSVEFKQNIK